MAAVVQHGWSWPQVALQQRAAAISTMPMSQSKPDVMEASRAARDRRLATILADTELARLLDERFDASEQTWTVDLLRADAGHGWRRQRYKYDAEKGALYFWGEQPVGAAEIRAMNLRTLPRIRPQQTPSPVAQPASTVTTGAVPSALQLAWGAALPQFSGIA